MRMDGQTWKEVPTKGSMWVCVRNENLNEVKKNPVLARVRWR